MHETHWNLNNPAHTAIGVVAPLASAVWAATTEGPWWVPLACAVVAALVPISNSLTKLWLDRQAARRAAVESDNEQLRCELLRHKEQRRPRKNSQPGPRSKSTESQGELDLRDPLDHPAHPVQPRGPRP